MNIIPAIDIIDGSCVRLSEGDYSKKTHYSSSPLDVAKSFEDAGCKYLHLVDLDGARCGKIVNYPLIEKIASHTNLHIDVGGGIKNREDLDTVFSSGAKEATLGSVAVKQRELTLSLLEEFGPSRLILGADCKGSSIAIGGWKETTSITVEEFVRFYFEKGFRKVISTDISKDGMLIGPSFHLYKTLLTLTEKYEGSSVIASGGVHSIEDVAQLNELKVDGVIIGKALYENYISLEELAPYLQPKGGK
jgi:phosphoribosylformimino-5-aminoimidazole carboxamide ribotide isomerase